MYRPDLDLLQSPPAPGDLVPPPRFRRKTFATYALDADVAGQAEAVAAVQDFARGPGLLDRWLRRGQPGLYLDGGFGVGKTHLLAACFHAAPGTRRQLAFVEAMGLMQGLGTERTVDLLAADLVCLDEFELDDPATLRLADLLLAHLFRLGCRVVTTSNAVPGEQGRGRLPVDQFRRELSRISGRFAALQVPGRDHRRHAHPVGDPPGWGVEPEALPDLPRLWRCNAAALDAVLLTVPVANLGRLADALDGLEIRDLRPFADQWAALRFVRLVDRLYDHAVPLRVASTAPIQSLFSDPACQEAFARKYRRCESRLVELCA